MVEYLLIDVYIYDLKNNLTKSHFLWEDIWFFFKE